MFIFYVLTDEEQRKMGLLSLFQDAGWLRFAINLSQRKGGGPGGHGTLNLPTARERMLMRREKRMFEKVIEVWAPGPYVRTDSFTNWR